MARTEVEVVYREMTGGLLQGWALIIDGREVPCVGLEIHMPIDGPAHVRADLIVTRLTKKEDLKCQKSRQV